MHYLKGIFGNVELHFGEQLHVFLFNELVSINTTCLM